MWVEDGGEMEEENLSIEIAAQVAFKSTHSRYGVAWHRMPGQKEAEEYPCSMGSGEVLVWAIRA